MKEQREYMIKMLGENLVTNGNKKVDVCDMVESRMVRKIIVNTVSANILSMIAEVADDCLNNRPFYSRIDTEVKNLGNYLNEELKKIELGR